MRKYVDGWNRFVLYHTQKILLWTQVTLPPTNLAIRNLKTYSQTWQTIFQERERVKTCKCCIFKLFVTCTKHWDHQWVFTLCGLQDLEMDDVIGCSVPSSHWVDCHTAVLSWVGQTSVVYQHAAISKGLEPPYKDKPNISLSKFLYQQYKNYLL